MIAITWPIYSKLKKYNHKYNETVAKLYDLSNDDLDILSDETYNNFSKFRFVPFVGFSETERKGKFVNYDEDNGRKVLRPKNCKKNIYMYGGSTMFGFNVADYQTISQHLQNLLNEDTCVYNHGKSYYYSKQENGLFLNHIENEKNIDIAIFLDGINELCGSYAYAKFLNSSFNLLVEKPYKMWQKTSVMFFNTLPLTQFVNIFIGKQRWTVQNNDNLIIKTCKKNNINELFKKRIMVRDGICSKLNIKCITFLQPFGGVHGKQSRELIKEANKKRLLKKYNKLKDNDGLAIDISNVFNKFEGFAYVDDVHYSPKANKIIAEKIKELL